jgi:hypothetical protein
MENVEKEICEDCGIGYYEEIKKDFVSNDPDSVQVTVPNVDMLKCTHCGEIVLPGESMDYIESYIDRKRGPIVDF